MNVKYDLATHLERIDYVARRLVIAQMRGRNYEIHLANQDVHEALRQFTETSFDVSLALQAMLSAFISESAKTQYPMNVIDTMMIHERKMRK